MPVMRLGYVHIRVTDLDAAINHYSNTLGMKLMHQAGGKVYFKSWDEQDHHSVVVEEGGVGLVKLGYKVTSSDDLQLDRRPDRQGDLLYHPDAQRGVHDRLHLISLRRTPPRRTRRAAHD
jgi:catechol 2,3-dioxygenase-like lactoylglutathione lyase family enzyme